jgi:hypothetical protein
MSARLPTQLYLSLPAADSWGGIGSPVTFRSGAHGYQPRRTIRMGRYFDNLDEMIRRR